jgi:hypothetical protein
MGQQASTCCQQKGIDVFAKTSRGLEEAPRRDTGGNDLSLSGGEALTADEQMEAMTKDLFDESDQALLEGKAPEEKSGLGLWGAAAEEEKPANDLEGYSETADNIGDHVCPKIGEDAVAKFLNADRLSRLLEASKEDMGKHFSLGGKQSDETGQNAAYTYGIAMAVSDPHSEDCPLVFVSNGFEDLTGYTSSFVVGRSCRFLQPTSKVLNDGVNLNERKMMRAFCVEPQPPGTMILNLLVNERQTGERFWNLLRMQYVNVDNEEYIFGVQTTLHAFMPKLLTKRLLGQAKNNGIVEALGPFLHALEGMRAEIQKAEFTPIMELKGYYTCALNMLQMLPALTKINAVGGGALNKVLDANAAEKPAGGNTEEVKQILAVGCTVTVDEEMKYPTYKVPKKTNGKILSIDSFGTCSIEWEGIGKKGCLKRDVHKLKVIKGP